jgi:hypothetical protein
MPVEKAEETGILHTRCQHERKKAGQIQEKHGTDRAEA